MSKHPTEMLQTVQLPPGLYLVATPIGNLRDMSLRALDVLNAVDMVVCEDTRVSGKLLKAYGIDKKLFSYNDHNAGKQRGPIMEKLSAGQAIALVSDAGMPLINDPGYKLVRDCQDLGIAVTTIPGASAPLAALQLCGLPSDKFCFLGFLPAKTAARKKLLEEWKIAPATLIAFDTGPRLLDSLKDIKTTLGDRPMAVVREITKMHEEVMRGPAAEIAHYLDGAPKGEIVIVIGPPAGKVLSEEDIEDQLRAALQDMKTKDAADFVAQATGQSKKKLYELALKIAKDG